MENEYRDIFYFDVEGDVEVTHYDNGEAVVDIVGEHSTSEFNEVMNFLIEECDQNPVKIELKICY
jgi:hypothetical protein